MINEEADLIAEHMQTKAKYKTHIIMSDLWQNNRSFMKFQSMNQLLKCLYDASKCADLNVKNEGQYLLLELKKKFT